MVVGDSLRVPQPCRRNAGRILVGQLRRPGGTEIHDATDFREAVLRAVNLGDDADTTGAVCGQLAGACWGESGIPQEWLEGLARKEMIEEAMSGLGAGKP